MKAPGFWYRPPGFWARILSPFGAVYAAATRRRLRGARPYRPRVPVLCAGNLVAGGAGKTPLAIALGRAARERGLTPAFLSRGYGGTEAGPVRVDPARHGAADVGDEPLLLAAQGPTYVARDRAAGAQLAEADGCDVIIMDDGFQNPGVAQDLSIVVVDGQTGFGNGRVIPAGPLRERIADGLGRAHAVVLMGEVGKPVLAQLANHDLPVLRASLKPAPAAAELRDQTVVAFAGIGRPAKFFDMLDRIGADTISRFSYPDHHRYSEDDIMRLVEMASAAEGQLVTTTKDFARLPADARRMVIVVEVQLSWADPVAANSLLDGLLPEPRNTEPKG